MSMTALCYLFRRQIQTRRAFYVPKFSVGPVEMQMVHSDLPEIFRNKPVTFEGKATLSVPTG